MLVHRENLSKEQKEDINELCSIYYSSEFNKQIDAPALNLLMSLIGFAPIGAIPQDIDSSINSFRKISHDERYAFTMTSISSLLDFPSSNVVLQDAFERFRCRVPPVTDGAGQVVLENGNLNFGKYKDAPLKLLIFRQRP